MRVETTSLGGHLILDPHCHKDARGFFMESYQRKRYAEAGIADEFVQDNVSSSAKGVLRGLHFQVRHPLARIVTVLRGRIFDVAVDLRAHSVTFGRWHGVDMSEESARQVYLPSGFAHGFCVLSDSADLHYKMSGCYSPEDEAGVTWNDPDIGVIWPISPTSMSAKDAAFPKMRDLKADQLPHRH